MLDKCWTKVGMIYRVDNTHPQLLTYASNPLALHLDDDVYRIFYSGRDSQNRSSISYVDYDIVQQEIVNDHKLPIASPTEGTFYSDGITIGNLWEQDGEQFIGFMGWQQREGEHWRGDIGKVSLTTGEISLVLGVNSHDKISLSYPHVMRDEDVYKMWYGSTIDWTSENGEMIHVLNYATSDDGEEWITHGLAVPYEVGTAQAFSKPCVLRCADGYHMWFSYRSGTGTPYRLGYSFSSSGQKWSRTQSTLSVSTKGWDSEMVCYPYVFEHKNLYYMLYNGNHYGRDGFGLAYAQPTQEITE